MTDEERLIRDSAGGFAAHEATPRRFRARRDAEIDFDLGVWRKMAALGWTALPDEMGPAEICAMAEEFGRKLLPEPFVPSAIFAARLRPQGEGGDLIQAVAWQERPTSIDPAAIATIAEPGTGGVSLSGVKRYIRPAAGCDGFIVSAKQGAGIGLYWLPQGKAGMALSVERQADGGTIGTLTLDRAFCPDADIVATPTEGLARLEEALDIATIAASAELLGVMSEAFEATLDYLRTRQQFGKPIGSFQALRHRAVDLYLARELAAVALDAAIAGAGGPQRSALASRAKARASDSAFLIAREAIQLHGGIGFTDECDIGLYLKRTLVLAAWLGNGHDHRRRYGELSR